MKSIKHIWNLFLSLFRRKPKGCCLSAGYKLPSCSIMIGQDGVFNKNENGEWINDENNKPKTK